jgi:alpha-tubulin suppressor-like RCC1 family protein
VVGWGDNRYRQATAPVTNVIAISAGLHYSLAILGNGRVVAWGLNLNNRASVPGTAVDAISITAAYNNSVIALRNGSLITIGLRQQNSMITRTPTSIVLGGSVRSPTPTRTR